LQDVPVMTVLNLFSGFSCGANLHLFCACCRVPQFRQYTAADYAWAETKCWLHWKTVVFLSIIFSYHHWTFSAVNIQGFLIEEVVWELWESNFCISQNSIHNISEHAGTLICFQDLELLWIWIQCHWLLLDFWRWVQLRRITCCNTHQSNFWDVHCYFLYFLEWTLLPWWTLRSSCFSWDFQESNFPAIFNSNVNLILKSVILW